ncbi:MAG: hypothetical protein ABI414_12570 [Devosia sp.]
MADRRKLESGMLVLAAFGALLLVPPLVLIFNQRISHFGIPQIVVYLFAVWALLVIGTAVLTHYLPRHEPPDSGPGGG